MPPAVPPTARHAPDPGPDAPARPASTRGASALPDDGWIVGTGPTTPAARPDAARRRSARLEARVAVYAQYAAVVAEQAEATLDGDAARVAALAERRQAVAEHFDELRAVDELSTPPGTSAAAGEVAPFGQLLGDALSELEHQAAVDLALRQRLVGLREAVLRGAAWGSASGGDGGSAGERPGGPAVAGLLPGAAGGALDGGLANALVSARVDGIGGGLGGHFPGRATGAPAAPGGEVGGQVDVRF